MRWSIIVSREPPAAIPPRRYTATSCYHDRSEIALFISCANRIKRHNNKWYIDLVAVPSDCDGLLPDVSDNYVFRLQLLTPRSSNNDLIRRVNGKLQATRYRRVLYGNEFFSGSGAVVSRAAEFVARKGIERKGIERND